MMMIIMMAEMMMDHDDYDQDIYGESSGKSKVT